MIRQRKWNGGVAKDLRLKHEFSPEDVAERTGVHRSTVYDWEAGQSPQMRHAVLLADLYDVPLDVFFVTERASTPPKGRNARNGNGSSAVSSS